jgi:glycerophosphoryl diester phosphodiesterase
MSIAALLVSTLLAAGSAELTGIAILPADTFAGGPPSGAYDDAGARAAQPRFASQPVQGISSIKPGPRPGTWWALSDNGFGARWNSYDYRLAIHLFALEPRTRAGDPRGADRRRVRLQRRIELHDPQRLFPWRLTEESLPGRPFTGADVDPESLLVMPDGSFWIGDEVGPWLLHFSARGALLEPPYELQVERNGSATTLRSAVHPLVLAGKAKAQLRASKGFEGLAAGPDGTLRAMLEGALPDDPPEVLRIFEFNLEQRRYSGRSWRYRVDDAAHSIGELAAGGGSALLVIERDQLAGAAARFKRIFRVDPADVDADGMLRKQLRVDLLAIDDPRHLAGASGAFRFPYWTTESVQWLSEHELLVVNDNNFPDAGTRAPGVRDATEWIWLRIP